MDLLQANHIGENSVSFLQGKGSNYYHKPECLDRTWYSVDCVISWFNSVQCLRKIFPEFFSDWATSRNCSTGFELWIRLCSNFAFSINIFEASLYSSPCISLKKHPDQAASTEHLDHISPQRDLLWQKTMQIRIYLVNSTFEIPILNPHFVISLCSFHQRSQLTITCGDRSCFCWKLDSRSVWTSPASN